MEGEDKFGDTSVRPRRTPAINFQATSLTTLIPWDKDIHEPVFTCSLSNEEIRKLIDHPFPAPYFPLHTQYCEWAVKQTTEAAANVVGYKRRDGYILSRVANRKKLPKFKSKKDILTLLKD